MRPKPLLSHDCRLGRHAMRERSAWDQLLDEPARCRCRCDGAPLG